MTSAPLPADPAALRAFVLAGRAVFTVQNAATGGRFTYKVSRCDGNPHIRFVSVLTGPDSSTCYTYLGTIAVSPRTPAHCYGYHHSAKSTVRPVAPSACTFVWLWEHLRYSRPLPPSVTMHHEGRCARCGRVLTVPESIAAGYGPECIGRLA
jgi:hypothetical protein